MAVQERYPDAVICDLDGTLALLNGRDPFDWNKIGNDKVNTPVQELLALYHHAGFRILIVSGRDENAGAATQAWLKKNKIKYDKLFLRSVRDNTSNVDFKRSLYLERIHGNYHIHAVLEDQPEAAAVYRNEFNLTVLQVWAVE